MASRQVRANVVAVALVGAAVGLVTNYASASIPSWFQDQPRVWLVFCGLVILSVAVQLYASREKAEVFRARNVPSRNPHFTGRAKDLRALRRLLRKRSRVAVHAVRGMGGVGKTQLVLEFCHRHRVDVMWWIAAENPTLIPDQLCALGRALGLNLPPEAADGVPVVVSHLSGLRKWLLVFDNAESAADLRPFVPSGSGKVLITTRNSGFDAMGGVLDLDTMPRQESVALLSRRAPGLTADQADELAELLGDLPLGLEQAAAYLGKTQMPAHEYLDLLRASPDSLADKGEGNRSLHTLWTLSFQRLDEEHPEAAQLSAICAHLAPESIPLDLFTANSSVLPAPLREAAVSPAELSHVVGVLTSYSLVKRDQDSLAVHRLVQLAARRHGTTEQDRLEWTTALLRVDLPRDIYYGPSAWPRWKQLLPHVLAVLDHITRLDVVSETTSWLFDRTGTYFQTIGQVGQALPLLERALSMDEEVHGPEATETATGLCNLATVLTDLGRLTEARALLERALVIEEAVHGPDHPELAVCLSNLATVLRWSGQLAQARGLLERALDIALIAYGEDHQVVAIRLCNLAMVLSDLGRSDEARALLERALAIEEAVLGPDHPSLANSLNSLAIVLRRLGRSPEARPLAERALAIAEAVYGPDHPDVGFYQDNLALLLEDLG